uniref:Uncharacterized protein n=1 Tax=Ralstonia solanacearum CFBP2957 TaxID=859656 RepID=D8P5X5_RALSL|nr:protein of unknown function [Ralstonia solanacearum CFBP2957]
MMWVGKVNDPMLRIRYALYANVALHRDRLSASGLGLRSYPNG